VRTFLSDSLVQRGGLEGDVNLGITARRGRIHSADNHFNVATQSRPLLIADNHKRDFPVFQVLLVTHVLVSRQPNLETCILRSCYQLAIGKSVPSAFSCFNPNVVLESISKRGRRAVIEEYQHRPLGRVAEREARQGSTPRIR